MPLVLHHLIISQALEMEEHPAEGGGVYFTANGTGEFDVLAPGKLVRNIYALVRHTQRVDLGVPDPPSPPRYLDGPGSGLPPMPQGPRRLHNGVTVNNEGMELQVRIYTPRNQLFTAESVTLDELRRFRDDRGTPEGRWRYEVSGRSRTYSLNPALHETATIHSGLFELRIDEEVASDSAPPLVEEALQAGPQSFDFDLHRVGRFVARASTLFGLGAWRGRLSVLDPDGAEVQSSHGQLLSFDVPLAMLGKSRDAAGNVRKWRLQTAPDEGVAPGARLTATILSQTRIEAEVLQSRLDFLLGGNGEYIKVQGVTTSTEVMAELTITDAGAAETADMQGLFDKVLGQSWSEKSIEVNKPAIIMRGDRDLGYGLALDASDFSLKSLSVSPGPGNHLGAETPSFRVKLKTDGALQLTFEGQRVVNCKIRGGEVELEFGVRIDDEGVPGFVAWAPDDVVDVDLNALVAVIASALSLPLGITAIGAAEAIEAFLNSEISRWMRGLFADPTLAPRIMMAALGGHFRYRSARFEDGAIVFEYVAPEEPDPKPRPAYKEAIGRELSSDALRVTFRPQRLPETWVADNLKSRIDHIVVVMMENRSYDHVLGYRSLTQSDGADGLSEALIEAVRASDGHQIRRLKDATFSANRVGKKTRLPKSVGHDLEDVAEQTAIKIPGPNNRTILGPGGFTENFRKKSLWDPENQEGVIPDDVLGYYEGDDLPIFEHLARNYAYCDAYFCSHPGPTLPNRMYALTGDVQYDRFGAALLHNNLGANFPFPAPRPSLTF